MTQKKEKPYQLSMSFLPEFPANRIARPGQNEARKMTVISGLACLKSLNSAAPGFLLLRTLLASSKWYSTLYALSWKTRTTPSGRSYFQLLASKLPTNANDSGYWDRTFPTPIASDAMGGFNDLDRVNGRIVRIGKWGGRWGPKLNDLINFLEEEVTGRKRVKSRKMNPDWTEWLMGYPVGWTDTRKDKLTPHSGFAEEPKGLSRMKEREERTGLRTKAIGNAILPQIVTMLGYAILEQERSR